MTYPPQQPPPNWQPPIQPAPQGYGAPPPGYPPPRPLPYGHPQWVPPPKSGTPKWLLPVLIGIGVTLIGIVAGVASMQSSPTGSTSSVAIPENAAARTVRLDDLSVTVTKVERGATATDGAFTDTKAKGEFVFVTLAVENVGDGQASIHADDQFLVDDRGRLFSADTSADWDLNDELKLELNPGMSGTRIIPFDVPKGTVLAEISLSEGLFSSNKRISLR